MTMRGGRFEEADDARFTALNDSLPVDARLVREDVEGSIAWTAALHDAGVLGADEAARLRAALREIGLTAQTKPERLRGAADEDIHAWVERELIERVGALGRKLHTGRSRNDQVATDLRLGTMQHIRHRIGELHAAQASLVALAEREMDTVLPGYTHLQRAQPVLFGHWCLAYYEMLDRDVERLSDASRRMARCPLGSGALAGTTYRIDRDELARQLGFEGPTTNSLDAVSDRDFVVETLAAIALCAVHLSRLAEDLIFFNSAEAGFIELSDAVTSGSSLMPQKKNPDALELLRGKAGGAIGALVAVAVTLKGLPLAYNKDMQEDKAPLFAAMDALGLCLAVLPPVLDGLRVHDDVTRAAAAGGHANATELADYLVARGVPFRTAHEQVGRIVRQAISTRATLEALSIEEMAAVAPQIDGDVREHLTIDAGLAKRDVHGGTAPERVRAAIAVARARLEQNGT